MKHFRETRSDEASPAIPMIDWNGNGRMDSTDIGIGLAFARDSAKQNADLRERIALISCSKLKKPYRCAARELYSASTLFSLSYAYAKANADRVFILSAKYGLVGEAEVLEPYNETLNEKTPSERQAWSQMVLEQLNRTCDIQRTDFVILAGKHYYEYLLPCLPQATLPLGSLPLGKRIAFLQEALEQPAAVPTDRSRIADRLHLLFGRLPVYHWQRIDDIPFQNGIYLIYEQGETYRGHPRIVRVGTHTSQSRLKQRLKDHFVRENHNGSIFRKNIGKAMLNRDRDPYLPLWTLDTSRLPNLGKADKVKEAEVERQVSAYMRDNLTFRVFPVENGEERLRLEEAVIASLNQASDFKATRGWLGNSSPEREIRQSGMWLKQGLDSEPLTDGEFQRLSHLVASAMPARSPESGVQEPASAPQLKAGDRVHHRIFGEGTVLSVQPMGLDSIIEVDFGKNGRRRLMLQAAKRHLRRVDA